MKKCFLVSVVVFSMVLMLSVGNVLAVKPMTPDGIDGVKVVDAAWVKSNMDKIKVFDVRKKAEYVEAHIPGAVNVWYHEKSKKTADFDSSRDRLDLSKFPADKNEPVIVHCNGPRCWKSYKAAVLLTRAGYKNVYWFRGGFPEWKAKGYPVE
jgi:rhodanese-related sulfurtransferase